jgi:hypothetical protein
MMQIGLIGIGAGAAAALLFASVSSGSWLSIALFYLAPLPLMIAGIGWSHWAALTGAAFGAVALGLVFSSVFLFAFVASAGLPAWWLAYLAMLARPAPAGETGTAAFEWYPPGRLVAWAAALGGLVVLAAIPNLGFDGDSFRDGLARAVTHLLQVEGETASGASVPGVSNLDRLIDFLVEAIPPAAAVIATLTSVINLWLAARIVKFSGRLNRPWPDVSSMRFPPLFGAALALAAALSFVGGIIGIIAGVFTASLLIAYGILGFAVLHAVTQGTNARGFLLGGAYAAVMVFGWPMLAMCLIGMIDAVFDLRGRLARKRGPPAPF